MSAVLIKPATRTGACGPFVPPDYSYGSQHVASHFFALPLAQNLEYFLAVFVFLPHHVPPFVSSKLPQSGGGGGAAPHAPHDASHFFAMLLFLHLPSFLLHHVEPFLSTQPLEGGGGGVAPPQ